MIKINLKFVVSSYNLLLCFFIILLLFFHSILVGYFILIIFSLRFFAEKKVNIIMK